VKLECLRELVHERKTDPHYQHREMDAETFLTNATKSFARLSDAQQKKVKLSWQKVLVTAGEELGPANKEKLLNEMMEARYLAQTNLFFLCHLLGYKDMTVGCHEEICNDFFVSKDPSFNTMEQFAKQYPNARKRRMLLVPRNGFKSTMDAGDTIQWIINYPETTILIMTGTLPLATAFVKEIREHFELQLITEETDAKGKPIYKARDVKNDITGERTADMFQMLFPEHCIVPGQGKAGEYNTPACEAGDKEPTVRAAGIEQSLSGFHFEILKLDDVVQLENSGTPDQIEKVNKRINVNRGMLNPYGFIDVIGTAYDENDFYGQILKNEAKSAMAKGLLQNIKGSIDEGKYNSDINVICYVRACWQVKPESKDKAETELLEDDYIYWFPERLTYEWLMNEKLDEEGFAIKYLNDPRKRNKVKISRELLMKKTIPHSQMPPGGIVVTAVDMAYSGKPWADFTVILTAIIYGGRFYIINMDRGRWSEYESPKHIANVAFNWKPKHIAIEESMGVGWLKTEVNREMAKFKIQVPIRSVSLGKGSKSTSKLAKMKPVVRMLGDDRIYFMQSCAGLEEIYSEISQFTGGKDDKHDDIVSAISILVDQFGAYANMEGAPMPQGMMMDSSKEQDKYNMIFGIGKYANHMGADDNPATLYQVDAAQQIMSNVALDALKQDPLEAAGLFD
jgi:phage terminase large subunit-like protein